MKREMGLARCGLACCLCAQNDVCGGCGEGDAPEKSWCENRRCSIEKNIAHCADCETLCKKGMFEKAKPYAFTLFLKRYGEEELLNCLERNEQNGIVYHRDGIISDYDGFGDAEAVIAFIKTGKR